MPQNRSILVNCGKEWEVFYNMNMVAFSPEGRREYELLVNDGDPEVKKVSGLQEEFARLTHAMITQLPTEDESETVFSKLRQFAQEIKTNPHVNIASIQSYVIGILRQYPIFKEIFEKHLIGQIPESKPHAINLAYALDSFIEAEETHFA